MCLPVCNASVFKTLTCFSEEVYLLIAILHAAVVICEELSPLKTSIYYKAVTGLNSTEPKMGPTAYNNSALWRKTWSRRSFSRTQEALSLTDCPLRHVWGNGSGNEKENHDFNDRPKVYKKNVIFTWSIRCHTEPSSCTGFTKLSKSLCVPSVRLAKKWIEKVKSDM